MSDSANFWVILAVIVPSLAFIYSLFNKWRERYEEALRDKFSDHEERKNAYADLRGSVGGWLNLSGSYTRSVRSALRVADKFFEGKRQDYDPPRDMDWRAPSMWSGRALLRCLMLALIYPIGAAMLGWIVTGNGGAVAEALGFPSGIAPAPRLTQAVIFGLTVWLILRGIRDERISWLFLILGLGLSYLGPQLVEYMYGRDAVALAVALAGALVVAFAGFGAGAVAVAFAVAFVGFGAVALAGVGAVGLAGIVAFAFGGVVAGAVAFMAKLADKSNWQAYLWVWFIILALAAYVSLAAFIGSRTDPNLGGMSIYLALGLLPLVNAPFDWLSTGLTRKLIYRGYDKGGLANRLVCSGLDLFGALVAMFALLLVMIFLIETVNQFLLPVTGGLPYLDIAALLQDVKEHPFEGRHFWLYFMLFSTLLPTLIHSVIGSMSLMITLTQFGKYIGKRMDKLTVGAPQKNYRKLARLLILRWILAITVTAAICALFLFIVFGVLNLGTPLVTALTHYHEGVQTILSEIIG